MFSESKIKLWIFDAVGTLRRFTVSPGEVELMPGVEDWFSRQAWHDKRYGIVSNQGVVDMGRVACDSAHRELMELVDYLPGRVVSAGCVRLCPSNNFHHPDRKPNPGMLFKVIAECAAWGFPVMLDEVAMVGDTIGDKEAADRAGVYYIHPRDLFGWAKQ